MKKSILISLLFFLSFSLNSAQSQQNLTLENSSLRKITHNPGENTFPKYNPKGDAIIYSSTMDYMIENLDKMRDWIV